MAVLPCLGSQPGTFCQAWSHRCRAGHSLAVLLLLLGASSCWGIPVP